MPHLWALKHSKVTEMEDFYFKTLMFSSNTAMCNLGVPHLWAVGRCKLTKMEEFYFENSNVFIKYSQMQSRSALFMGDQSLKSDRN